MNRQQVRDAVIALERGDVAGAERLVHAIERDAWEAPQALIELWRSHPARETAMDLLADLGELAVRPLLAAAGTTELSAERVWLWKTVVAAEAALRDTVIAALVPLLDDRTGVPVRPIPGPSEAQPPPRRICDEAYLLLRQVLKFTEDAAAQAVNADAFLALEPGGRDEEIARLRASRTFTDFLVTLPAAE